jgi:23S rRNA (cytidine1920-2'-O)/16S rRNA (cytidine1409-2'-O)-methyltransferase
VPKERIDKLLVEQGLVETRQKAQALILAGQVLANNQLIDKAGQKVDITSQLRIKGEQLKYVSRAGLKLEAALNHFDIKAKDKLCLDIGASTGGFTDCLLQNGAKEVFALDVGHNQLDWRIRQHPKVKVIEGVNARYLKTEDFPYLFDIVVVDVSFISLSKIFPVIPNLVKNSSEIVTLIKPQFEVGAKEVGKGGIVSDPSKHSRVINEVIEAANSYNFNSLGVIDSPITGADGNKEFLSYFIVNPNKQTSSSS